MHAGSLRAQHGYFDDFRELSICQRYYISIRAVFLFGLGDVWNVRYKFLTFNGEGNRGCASIELAQLNDPRFIEQAIMRRLRALLNAGFYQAGVKMNDSRPLRFQRCHNHGRGLVGTDHLLVLPDVIARYSYEDQDHGHDQKKWDDRRFAFFELNFLFKHRSPPRQSRLLYGLCVQPNRILD